MESVKMDWGNEFDQAIALTFIAQAKRQNWIKKKWVPSLTLVNKKNGLREFRLQGAPIENYFEIVSASDHSHCEICWIGISDFEGDEQQAYLPENLDSNLGWVCVRCYENLVLAKHPEFIMKERNK